VEEYFGSGWIIYLIVGDSEEYIFKRSHPFKTSVGIIRV
jgi:hypothetical protein